MSGGNDSSQPIPCFQSCWKMIFTTIVTHELRPSGSKIFGKSDNTLRLARWDGSMERSADENRKQSLLELYSMSSVLTKLSESPNMNMAWLLRISCGIQFNISVELESHL